MNETVSHCLTCSNLRNRPIKSDHPYRTPESTTSTSKKQSLKILLGKAFILSWSWKDVLGVGKYHPTPCVFGAVLLFFYWVEHSMVMTPPYSPPFDIGFALTQPLHRILSTNQALHTILAVLNTVFVLMQSMYMYWTWLVEGRTRPCAATVFMFTCRGILGCSTQLPLPEGFLGSWADVPIGNASFFLFFSGHVASAVIASLDMRRMQRWALAWLFDILNVMQVVRLLATRGHYTIDLVVGVGAGILFDLFAGKYELRRQHEERSSDSSSPTRQGTKCRDTR